MPLQNSWFTYFMLFGLTLFSGILNGCSNGSPSYTEFLVSPQGNDGAAGTATAPFATLERARDAIRSLPQSQRTGDIVVTLKDGNYRFYTDGGSRYIVLKGNVSYDNTTGFTDFGPPATPYNLLPYPPYSGMNNIPYGFDLGGCQTYGDITYQWQLLDEPRLLQCLPLLGKWPVLPHQSELPGKLSDSGAAKCAASSSFSCRGAKFSAKLAGCGRCKDSVMA